MQMYADMCTHLKEFGVMANQMQHLIWRWKSCLSTQEVEQCRHMLTCFKLSWQRLSPLMRKQFIVVLSAVICDEISFQVILINARQTFPLRTGKHSQLIPYKNSWQMVISFLHKLIRGKKKKKFLIQLLLCLFFF